MFLCNKTLLIIEKKLKTFWMSINRHSQIYFGLSSWKNLCITKTRFLKSNEWYRKYLYYNANEKCQSTIVSMYDPFI